MRPFILLCCLITFCLSPIQGFSQNATLNIAEDDTLSIEHIFELIKSKTDYQFFYRYDLIKDAPKVTVKKGVISVEDLLKKGLDKISCTYEFKANSIIVVKPKQPRVKRKDSIKKNNSPLNTISGQITFNDYPLENIIISIVNSKATTITDAKGQYSIQAEIGSIITYSNIDFNTVSTITEDITTVLNIEMMPKANVLAEVLVIGNKNPAPYELNVNKKDERVKTSKGKINPMLLPSKVKYIKGKQLQKQYRTLSDALKFHYPNGLPARVFDIDGVIYKGEPYIDLFTIIDLYVVTGNTGAMNWGEAVIIIRTTNGPEYKEKIAEEYRNQSYYNNDAVAANRATTFSSLNTISHQPIITKSIPITGTVTYLDQPHTNVSISVVGKRMRAKTNTEGHYTLKVDIGDIIQYKMEGFATVSIIVEEDTEILNIEIVPKQNELNEVTVTADLKHQKDLDSNKKSDKVFSTARGSFNSTSKESALSYFEIKDINAANGSLGKALEGKISGLSYDYVNNKLIAKPKTLADVQKYVIWDVDGVIYDNEPLIDLSTIKDIRVIKSLAGTVRYGPAGAGGVIVVETIRGDFNPLEAQQKNLNAQYTNNKYYADDAVFIDQNQLNSNTYTEALTAFSSKQKAYIYYDDVLKPNLNSYSEHISIAQKFITHFKDLNLAKQILKELASKHNKHTEILKAIAYQYQALGLKRQSIKTYERVYKLRPNYAQSYRDLANAYIENDQYKRAWRLYMSYLMQGNAVNGEGIGELLYNEMEFLYFNRKHQTKMREMFVPKSDDLFDFRNDIRLVFEWNTSEAEFDLEFVNPDKRSYVFEHSLVANPKLITNEKQKGYSSKSFFIDDIGTGEWLVNISYKGNKKSAPTYFKVTKYLHWGKPHQQQEITVYKFESERDKIQLMQLNKNMLVASD